MHSSLEFIAQRIRGIRAPFTWSVVALSLLPVAACALPGSSGPSRASGSSGLARLRNPINAGLADPFVFYHGGQYYLTGTSTAGSLEMWHSPRLETLAQIDSTIIWTPGPSDPAYQIWSPSVFQLEYQGARSWFVYFTASSDNTNESHRIYVLQSQGNDPLGPYTFRGQLHGSEDVTAIDPSIITIAGKLYIVDVQEFGSNAIFIAPLSDPLTQSGPAHLINSPDEPWERGAGAGQSSYPVAEGPTALYHDGKTFIVYSGSDTGNYDYCLGLLTYDGAGDPLSARSWAKTGPAFTYSQTSGVYGPGRATFTTSPDGKQDWMVYHAKDTNQFTYEGRTTRAQPFTWNADGTPHFGVPVSLAASLAPPSGE